MQSLSFLIAILHCSFLMSCSGLDRTPRENAIISLDALELIKQFELFDVRATERGNNCYLLTYTLGENDDCISLIATVSDSGIDLKDRSEDINTIDKFAENHQLELFALYGVLRNSASVLIEIMSSLGIVELVGVRSQKTVHYKFRPEFEMYYIQDTLLISDGFRDDIVNLKGDFYIRKQRLSR